MNAELPPFLNRNHTAESASTIDRAITPLTEITILYGPQYKNQACKNFYIRKWADTVWNLLDKNCVQNQTI